MSILHDHVIYFYDVVRTLWLFLIALRRSFSSFVDQSNSLSARKAVNTRWETGNKSTSASKWMHVWLTLFNHHVIYFYGVLRMSWLFLSALRRSFGSFVDQSNSLCARKTFHAHWEAGNKSCKSILFCFPTYISFRCAFKCISVVFCDCFSLIYKPQIPTLLSDNNIHILCNIALSPILRIHVVNRVAARCEAANCSRWMKRGPDIHLYVL